MGYRRKEREVRESLGRWALATQAWPVSVELLLGSFLPFGRQCNETRLIVDPFAAFFHVCGCRQQMRCLQQCTGSSKFWSLR